MYQHFIHLNGHYSISSIHILLEYESQTKDSSNYFTDSFWDVGQHVLLNRILIYTMMIRFVALYFDLFIWYPHLYPFLEVITTTFEVLNKLIKAEKIQTVSHLTASISHEVRNPLTVTRGFIQLLSGEVSTSLRKDYADIALKELDRATEVINDYLTFARPALENKEKLNINQELQHAMNVITPLATMNGVQVQLSLLEQDFSQQEKAKGFNNASLIF